MHMENISGAVKNLGPIRIRLQAPDLYHEDERRQAVFIHVDDADHIDEQGGREFPLDRLYEDALGAVPRLERCAWYRSMTVGHALVGESADGAQSLLLRAGLLSGIEWQVDEIHVLVREGHTSESRPQGSCMMGWASISLGLGGLRVHQKRDTRLRACIVDNKAVAGRIEVPGVRSFYNDPILQKLEEFAPFFYNGVKWSQSTPNLLKQRSLPAAQRTLTVASYNVLGRTDDLSMLTQNILHTNAEADVLVLQEMTDIVLSHLLNNKHLQEKYAFCTHRPFEQKQGSALPVQKMVVVLSKYAFGWEAIPLPLDVVEAGYRREQEKDHTGYNNVGDEHGDERTLVKRSTVASRTSTHNRALLVEFRRGEDSTDPLKRPPAPLALAAFHLTPGRYHEAYLARALELDAIRNYIFVGTPAILAGGFNMPTSTLTLRHSDLPDDLRLAERDLLTCGYVDAWMIAKMNSGARTDDDPVEPIYQGEQGCTNEAIFPGGVTSGHGHVQLSKQPQRFDRIFIKSNDILVVQNFNKFGKGAKAEQDDAQSITPYNSGKIEPYNPTDLSTETPASAIRDTLHDPKGAVLGTKFHCGVRAVLKLERRPSRPGPVSVTSGSAPSSASYLDNRLSVLWKGNESVLEALWGVHGIPHLEERQRREMAFEALKTVLLGSSCHTAASEQENSINFVILPVGSYSLDVWTSSSDIDCLCVGTCSLSTFVHLATQRIRQAPDKNVRLIRKTGTYMNTTIQLDIKVLEEHIRIDLTYARTSWPLPSADLTRLLSPDTLLALKPYRDLDYVQRSIPDIVEFRLAYRFIKKWAEGRGIYSAKFGYLHGIQITVLLTRIHKHLETKIASPAAPEILAKFFKEYASFNWKRDVVLDEWFDKNLEYPRTSQEPLAILSYFPPGLNTSSTVTASSVRTITEEFQRAERLLQQDATWADLLRISIPGRASSGSLASDDFLEHHPSYIKISAQYWGGSTTKGRGFIAWVELRCTSLLADLDKRLPSTHVRIWPTRYTEAEQSLLAGNEPEYQGIFLLGLDWMDSDGKEKLDHARDTLMSTLRRFEQQIRKDDRHFDANSMRISAEFKGSSDGRQPESNLYKVQIDNRNWDAYIQVDEDLPDEDEGRGLGQATAVQSEWSASSKNRKKSATHQPRSAVGLKPEGSGKFRTASDVLNRLRWDASYDHNDFVVGFEDRFLGAMERGLDAWKTEQTHEEFIPQHRILYFKRISNGVVIWERRTRTDLVFGSG